MNEYIIDVGDADELHFEVFQKRAEFCFGYPIREEVMRCRDCVYYDKYPNDDIYVCYRFDNEQPIVEPNGFCKWGERRSE